VTERGSALLHGEEQSIITLWWLAVLLARSLLRQASHGRQYNEKLHNNRPPRFGLKLQVLPPSNNRLMLLRSKY